MFNKPVLTVSQSSNYLVSFTDIYDTQALLSFFVRLVASTKNENVLILLINGILSPNRHVPFDTSNAKLIS
jgi:hypothetical protein